MIDNRRNVLNTSFCKIGKQKRATETAALFVYLSEELFFFYDFNFREVNLEFYTTVLSSSCSC